MLAKRIIPCLDVRSGRVVKGKKFTDISDVDDPVTLAKFYSTSGADELVFYDITASSEERDIFLDVVENTAKEINIPLTVGGGIKTVEDFSAVLKAGADKVSINSSAVRNPNLIKEGALKFGRQCVVLSMDIKRNSEGIWKVYVKGGREETDLEAVSWALEGEKLGAGEIVINSIDTDGVREGYDLDITKKISELVNVPVVASGGAGKKEDFLTVLTTGSADAALAASVFHYKEIDIKNLKEYLYENGVEVRRI
ncbi:imidazole glycerol phosphate synthase subunit HisF [Clostridium cylindrosporum]|uniref:Imidazole glycerol phosphate synthase subunit HisF n=1 Tax=Clostridium cylindrosporum DSM 605 TaxID=1121307 RepID=A0A0J8DED8_CLOCY|nr:imidazole glycerol phosphate synthase subunit HisF [Clostridium cylindrosporum]KMT22589.1 imidazole glycerol phosphate synthase subunit HisF [Clostridium cylindrosporum DSM 605]